MKSTIHRLILINLMSFLVFSSLHSQVIYFNGKNIATNESVKLDSIKIINNTLKRDTTIYVDSIDLSILTTVQGDDNFYNSDFFVEYISEFGNDELSFRVKANGEINLSINVFNLVGSSILSQVNNLYPGNHYIKLNEILMPGIYFASFSDGRTIQTIKILKTNDVFDNFSLFNQNLQEKNVVLVNDEYTFIGYAKGFRWDTIDTIAIDRNTYEFQLEKLGDWEFNDWSFYLASMSFLSKYRKYWYEGNPPSHKLDSNIYQSNFTTNVLDFIQSDFIIREYHNGDTNNMKNSHVYYYFKNYTNCHDYMICNIFLIFQLNIDTMNYIIKELKIEYSYSGYTITTYGGISLDDSYYFTLQNIPFINSKDGSIIAEVNADNYTDVLKEYKNSYLYDNSDHINFPIRIYIDWLELKKINNNIFFRLILSK